MTNIEDTGAESPRKPFYPIGGLGKMKKNKPVIVGGGLSLFFKRLLELASDKADAVVMAQHGRIKGGHHYNHGGTARTFKCHRRQELRRTHKRRAKKNPRIRVRA